MIVFKKVEFKNFLSYGNNVTTLNLNRDSNTLIVGKNGSGKSSVITDTLTFALYGKPYRKINKSGIVNSVNKKNCLVTVSFDKNGSNYVVTRGISPNIFEIYKDGDLINQNASTVDYQKVLEEEILQMNYNAFVQTIIVGKKYIPFMQLNTPDRRALIEELFDINYFSEMNSNIKAKVKLNKERISELGYKIENNKKLIENERVNLNILENQDKELIEKNRKDINNYEERIKEDKLMCEKIISAYKLCDEKIIDTKDCEDKIKKILLYENQLDNELKNLIKDKKFYENNDVCNVCRQKIEDNFKKKILLEDSEKISVKEENIKKLNSKKIELEDKLRKDNESNLKINNKKIELNKEHSRYLGEISNFNDLIEKLEFDIKKLENSNEIKEDKLRNIKKLEDELKDFEDEFNSKSSLQNYYDVILNILKDDGLKTYLIKMFLPLINNTLEKYMDIFNFNCSFTLDEQFNEVIKSRFRDKFTYYNFSEGEKQRIDFALLFVFRDIAKSRNSVNTNLLILDEVLDGSLDEDGINGFLHILRTIESDKDVFIISHHSEKYYDLFPNIIEVDKKINYSEIVVDTFVGKYKSERL